MTAANHQSFTDEDWTGFTKEQIYRQIVAELEEKQCKEEGHQWVPAYYCSVCGLQSSEALEQMTKKIKKRKSRHVINK